jgi:hypothetical protein
MNLPTGKAIRVFGSRGSQIGDSVAALTTYAYLRQRYPDCFTIWQVARKHLHAAPLFYENQLIDQLVISDCEEGYGPMDIALAETCQIRLPLMPEHNPQEIWPNLRSFYAETFIMSGLTMDDWRSVPEPSLRPRLTQWFRVERQPKTIGYWPCAAYGVPQTIWEDGKRIVKSRNASRPWAAELVKRLRAEGYKVIQFGHPRDYADCGGPLGADMCAHPHSFMTQIQMALGCDLNIGTDSGAAIALGAYGDGPNQISLLTNHYPGHNLNLTAFQPWNPNNHSFVGVGSADNISIDEVVEMAKQMTSS